jgi:hypothetical protein
MTASQIDFPLSVAVCAWCRPQDLTAGLGILSHGICLKHLRKLKLQARGLSPKRATRAPRIDSTQALPFPVE